MTPKQLRRQVNNLREGLAKRVEEEIFTFTQDIEQAHRPATDEEKTAREVSEKFVRKLRFLRA